MKKPFLLVVSSLVLATPNSWTADGIRLDQEFRLRLELPLKEEVPLSNQHPIAIPQRHIVRPLVAPALPDGARAFRFNGQTHYYIPLAGRAIGGLAL